MEESFDERIEKSFGKKPVKENEKYVASKYVSELYEVFVGSEEDIERERARREEQMRIDFLNNLKEDEENREQIEKINRENRNDIQILRLRMASGK